MSNAEPTPSAEPTLTRAQKEKLLHKMYSLPHWIALVRLFGYRTLSMDEARAVIKPIAEEFGKPEVADACEVLVEIQSAAKEPIARLKPHIRRMAFQILGPESKEQNETDSSPPKSHKAKSKPEGVEKPMKQPRHFVLKKCEAWMKESGFAYVAVADVKRTTPAVTPYVGSLDFIVLRGEEKLLVTVRPNLQPKHLTAISELQKLYGSEYRPVRIWPVEDATGWTWREHRVDLKSKPGS